MSQPWGTNLRFKPHNSLMKERISSTRPRHPATIRLLVGRLELPSVSRFPHHAAVTKIRINSWGCQSWTKVIRIN